MKKDYDSLLGLIVALFLVMGGFYSYVRLDQAEKIWLEPVLQLITPVRKGTPIQIRELETTYENSDRH